MRRSSVSIFGGGEWLAGEAMGDADGDDGDGDGDGYG